MFNEAMSSKRSRKSPQRSPTRNAKKMSFVFGDDLSHLHPNEKILQRCNIFSFFPMLQKEEYKLDGFIFKSSLHKMYLNNVQLFHYVSSDEQPKKIPAYTPRKYYDDEYDEDEQKIDPRESVISYGSSKHSKSQSLSNIKFGLYIFLCDIGLSSLHDI